MEVTRVAEHPRITKPFSEESWQALDALGRRVDAALQKGDVRLTMGGEPTFVSIDDYESEEWNTAAVGPHKRALADQLIRRLRARFAPGGFLHYGQGKWYPGETLPRWTFSLYWRKDGQPIWRNPELIAEEGDKTGATTDTARELLCEIAAGLDLPRENVLPAYEDPAEWLVKEANLPDNVTPDNPKLEDAEARHRMATVFDRGLTSPSGFVLPVQRLAGAVGRDAQVALGTLEDPARPAFPRARRQPGGLSPAARRAALAVRPRSIPISTRSIPRFRARRCQKRRCRKRTRPPRAPQPADGAFHGRRSRDRRLHPPGRRRARGCARDRWRRPHRAVGRAARRAALRLHAAGRGTGALPRPDRTWPEAAARRLSLQGPYRGLCAAARSAAERHPRRPRPRRDRGQHPPRQQLGRLRRDHHRRL